MHNLREVAQMHALRRALVNAAYQIAVNLLRHKRNHRRRRLGNRNKRSIQRHIRVNLILLHSLCPEALPATAHVPVAHLIHELLQCPRRLRNTVIPEIVIYCLHHAVQLGEQPPVHHGELLIVQRIFGCVEAVDIGIQDEKGIRIPKRTHELSLSLDNCLVMEAVRQPRCGIDIEIPADCVRAELLQRVKRVNRIPHRLAHLLAVFILHMPEYDNILIRSLVKQHR